MDVIQQSEQSLQQELFVFSTSQRHYYYKLPFLDVFDHECIILNKYESESKMDESFGVMSVKQWHYLLSTHLIC